MNKTILIVGCLSLFSCNKNEEAKHQINQSIDRVGDMQEWVREDINNGTLSAEWADTYVYMLDKIEQDLEDFKQNL